MLQSKNSVVLVKNLITKTGKIVPNFTNHRCKCNSRGKYQALTVRSIHLDIKYSLGILHSRSIGRCCYRNFMST